MSFALERFLRQPQPAPVSITVTPLPSLPRPPPALLASPLLSTRSTAAVRAHPSLRRPSHHHRHVSRRNHALRHRLRPRHPRSRPCLRVRTVCPLTPRPLRSSSLPPTSAPASSSHASSPPPSPPRFLSIAPDRIAPYLPCYAALTSPKVRPPCPLRHPRPALGVEPPVSTPCALESSVLPLMATGLRSWSTRIAAMPTMRTMRCTTSALAAMICSRLRYVNRARPEVISG